MPPFFFAVVLRVWLAALTQRSKGIQILRFSSSICLFPSLSAGEVLRPMLIEILPHSSSSEAHSILLLSAQILAFFSFFFHTQPLPVELWKMSGGIFSSCHVILAHILPCSASFFPLFSGFQVDPRVRIFSKPSHSPRLSSCLPPSLISWHLFSFLPFSCCSVPVRGWGVS